MKLSAIIVLLLVVMLPVAFAADISLTYDANGNLITGDGFYRVYNSLNQLSKIYKGNSTSGNLTEEYTFHPTEERVLIKKVYNATGGQKETVYYVSDEFVKVVNSSGTFDTTYVKHEGQLIAEQRNNTNKVYYHPDHLGSTTLITNSSGNVVDNTSYTPYGSIIGGNNTFRYSYTGKEFDGVNNEYDFNARRVNPSWGKFTSPDPIIQEAFDPQTLNHYVFVRNNPYLFIDPNGKDYRLYYNVDAAYGSGHFSIGIDLADEPVYEAYFEITGIGKDIGPTINDKKYPITNNDFVRAGLSIVGWFKAEKNPQIRKYRDDKGNILIPKDAEGKSYEDYFAFEQDSKMDYNMLQEAQRLTGSPWRYNAIVHNSLHFVINIVQSGYEVNFFGSQPQSFYNQLLKGKAVYSKSGVLQSYYQVVNGEKQFKVWNKGKGSSTGNAYCTKGC